MAEYSDRFGTLVREALDSERLSNREAARRAKGLVSHTTIADMRAGRVPNAEAIVALARALQRDPNDFLKAAGKSWLRFDVDAWTASGHSVIGAPA